MSYIDPINQSGQAPDQDMMNDAHACMGLIKKNLDYENRMRCAQWKDREQFLGFPVLEQSVRTGKGCGSESAASGRMMRYC